MRPSQHTSRFIVVALGACLVSARPEAAARADDDALYDLRGPAPEKGQIYVLTAKSNGKGLTRTIKVQDRVIEEKFDEVGSKKKEIEVLAVDGDEITRMRTKILVDRREEINPKRKKKDEEADKRALDGQIVYSERTKTGWKNTLEDIRPNPKQKKALKEYVPFKEDDLLVPKGKFKVGHTWKIEQGVFEKVLGDQLEGMRGTGTGKFLRVEKVDGEELAVIEVEFTITGKSKEDELTLDVTIKAKGTAHRSLKFGFDRKSALTTTLAMKGTGEVGGEKLEIDFGGVINSEDAVELKLKK